MDKEKKGRQGWIYILLGLICVIIVIVLIILSLLQGNKNITNSDGDVSVAESMTCSKDGILYPFFRYDDSIKKSIRINVVLNDNKLESINLVARLYYNNKEQIKRSNTENFIALNNSFYDDSMEADSFRANFSSLDDAMQMTLYAEAKELNGINSKYFLIDSASGYTKEKLKKEFNSHGLDCVIKEEKE